MSSTPLGDDEVRALVDVAAGMDAAFAGGLQTQLQWLEDAALALDAAGLAAAATDLKAALGAIAHWARGPRDPKGLPEVEGVVRAFTTRGVVALYRALASALREMADVRTPQRSLCLDVAAAFTALASAAESGRPPPKDALERLASARDVVDRPADPR